eukprot:4536835-Pleurochrysis_carterae.AAC.1
MENVLQIIPESIKMFRWCLQTVPPKTFKTAWSVTYLQYQHRSASHFIHAPASLPICFDQCGPPLHTTARCMKISGCAPSRPAR